MTVSAPATTVVGTPLNELSQSQGRWVSTSIADRVAILESVGQRMDFAAQRWVEAAAAAKRFSLGSAAEAEEWLSGPFAIIAYCRALAETLRRVGEGRNPYPARAVKVGADGRAIVEVLPFDWHDHVLLSGYTLEVWMDPSVSPANLAENTASIYRQTPEPGVCAILGAGNVGSIPPLDVLYKLMAANQVVIVKMSPVNEYLGPLLEEIFADLIEAGFVRIIYGGSEAGRELVFHPAVTSVHVTGNRATLDSIVPGLEKPVTSELGGVSPIIVVPGSWSEADFKYQAAQIATAKLINVGYNCIAPQILVLPANWDGSSRLVEAIGEVIDSLEPRYPYYPAGEERRAAVARRQGAVTVGGFPTTILPDLSPGGGEDAFRTEYFSPVLGVVKIDFSDPAYFLQAAVAFANNELDGSLGANLVIHPQTIREYQPHFDQAISNLRYGAIAINTWTALNFLMPRGSWGAFPRTSAESVGSGVGVVHNALLFDRPEKTVSRGPFSPMPRSWRQGEFHASPPPPWSLTARHGAQTARLLTRFVADPKPSRLPPLVRSALSG
ncbi:MAG: aldehyde dehydrogenase family protein [Acidimicrobiia bacterium]